MPCLNISTEDRGVREDWGHRSSCQGPYADANRIKMRQERISVFRPRAGYWGVSLVRCIVSNVNPH
jgi:hypothetical protein